MKEIKKITVNDNLSNEYILPTTIWLDISDEVKQKTIKINLDEDQTIDLESISKSTFTICNVMELDEFMFGNGITSYDLLRLEIRDTKKWGMKPLFKNGINNICFQVYIKKQDNHKFIVLYNTNGSHEVESIYMHGIWVI